ncbi:MAG: hypothetical protein HY858_07930 [Candidatus Solibacter usitatus]|nr:hypothetical protein [Candidatus Solibacter usitatus]
MKSKLEILAVAVVLALAVPTVTLAQGRGEVVSEEHRAEVSLPVRFDTTTVPLRDLPDRKPVTPARGGRDFEPGRPEPVGNVNPAFNDPLAATGAGPVKAFSVPLAASTDGTPVDPSYRVAPPDTTGDLGPNHYVQWVNLRYSIYTLTRDANQQITGFNLVGGFPKNGNVVWQGFGGACEKYNDGDPIVQYDQLADRWVLTQFAVSASPYTQCVAVSTGPDPTGTYNRYAYSYGTDFNDFPKMGVWPDAYYITYNMFKRGRTFSGNKVCAFERDKMLIGASARQICAQTSNSYHSLVPADLESATLPAAGTANPLLSISSSAVYFWKFAVNWTAGAGTLTGPTALAGVSAFSRACGGGTCIPQLGTTRTLDSLADRLNYRLSYRRFADHESLLINHAVSANSASGIRWYELRNATGSTISSATPVVYQQGTYSPNSEYRWMGSAAMDKTGGIAIGYNVSSAAIKPSIRYAYRGPADPLGILGPEALIKTGTGSQTGTLSRWGDYSTISVDPVDGCQLVFTTEYIPSDGSFNWSTFITSFKLSTCN